MNDKFQDRVKAKVTPEDLFVFSPDMSRILKQITSGLPKRDVPASEQRYPTTRSGVRANLESFFARHFHQMQDSLLLPETFHKITECCQRGVMRLADIGSGAGAASVAAMNIAAMVLEESQPLHRPLAVDVVLNDVSRVAMNEGVKLIRAVARNTKHLTAGNIVSVSSPFPKSIPQLQRIQRSLGSYDFCFMSYALVPVKEEAQYRQIASSLKTIIGASSEQTCGVVLQDKFHESMLRQLAAELRTSCNKVTIRQKVNDPFNSNEVQSYTFFRFVLACRSAAMVL